MTIKVQCLCGAKYSFDVEPVEGRMPFAVNCPVCQADGTELANELIATQLADKPRLHIHIAASPQEEAPAPVARPAAPALRAIDRLARERRQHRVVGWIAAGVVLVVVTLLGAWGWYAFVGSKPRQEYSIKLPGAEASWRARFLDAQTILLVSPSRAQAHNLATDKDLWSTALAGDGAESAAGDSPEIWIDQGNIWICLGTRVVRLDRASGEVKQTIPVTGEFESFTPGEAGLLVVSAKDQTTREVLQIDRSSGEVASQEIVVPRPETHRMPNDLPPNALPTAGALLAQATDEQKFNKPLDAMSSEFFSAGANLVELRVKLLEPKVAWVQSIKPGGASHLDGNTTASTSAGLVAEDLFNDIKRSQTGGVKGVDQSRYEVKLRRWLGPEPVEWTGEVTGVPMFFPLKTVDLLVAGQTLEVFDKQNNKLFEAKLTYALGQQFDPEHWDRQSVPAVETNSALYFFDAGVLTAFSLPAGDVRWRLTSIGISRLQFDGQGALYVDTTTANPEDVQYSEQINLEGAAPVLLKVEPGGGKILWQAVKRGQACFLSGKYLYSESQQQGGVAMAVGLAEALNAPRPEGPAYLHIYRLEPADGKVLWDFYREEIPDELSFSQNRFLLRFGATVEVWKFLSF